MSPGSRSGVHWTRANLPPSALRQGLGQRRLAQAGQVLDEQVPPRQQAGQHVLDDVRLAAEHAVERGADAVDRAGVGLVRHDHRRGHRLHGRGHLASAGDGIRPAEPRERPGRTADRQVRRMSSSVGGAGSSGPAGAWAAQSARRTRPSRAARGSPAARPATGKYQRESVSPGGRGRPAHRARSSISLKDRSTRRLGSCPGARPIAIVASRSSTSRRRSARTAEHDRGGQQPGGVASRPARAPPRAPGDPFGPGADRGHQLVAGGRLDGDPAPAGQPDLGPEVDVVAGHRRVPRPRVVTLRRRVQAADDAGRIAQRPEQHGRRGGEQVVGAAAGAQQELGDDVGAVGRGRGRSVVGVAAPERRDHRLDLAPALGQARDPALRQRGHRRVDRVLAPERQVMVVLVVRPGRRTQATGSLSGSTVSDSESMTVPAGTVRSVIRTIPSCAQPKKSSRLTLPTRNRTRWAASASGSSRACRS